MVTGGKGFIGSHVAYMLAKLKAEVLVVDMNTAGFYIPSPKPDNPNYITFDLSKTPEQVEKILEWWQPEVIIHLAAWSNVGDSMNNPAMLYRMNVMPTANLIHALARLSNRIYFLNPVKHVIFASSSAAVEPITSHYGASKRSCEHIWQAFQRATGIPVALLRFGNVYGPGQNPANGTLIPNAIIRTMKGSRVEIFGSGDQTRDYIYINSLVGAIKMVMNARLSGVHNVSSGVSHTTLEVVTEIRNALELDGITSSPPVYSPERSGDKAHVALPCSEALLKRGFTVTELRKGITLTCGWYKWVMKGSNFKGVKWGDEPCTMDGRPYTPHNHHTEKVETLSEWMDMFRLHNKIEHTQML
jgi:UDP-glucose 4-epimerase